MQVNFPETTLFILSSAPEQLPIGSLGRRSVRFCALWRKDDEQCVSLCCFVQRDSDDNGFTVSIYCRLLFPLLHSAARLLGHKLLGHTSTQACTLYMHAAAARGHPRVHPIQYHMIFVILCTITDLFIAPVRCE